MGTTLLRVSKSFTPKKIKKNKKSLALVVHWWYIKGIDKRTKGKTMKNLKMNKEVYQLRRNVIELIYELKDLYPNLPRVTVRITEDSDKISGVAELNGYKIWVPANSANRNKASLRRTVYHEVLHAVFGVGHFKGCPLMGPVWTKISKVQAGKLFLSYAKGGN